jgi:pseudouridine-5'-phosphate glycosidase
MTELIDLTDELRSALSAQSPVVALESTVIAHGLPRPQNLETARRLEQIVREGQSVPATIAMVAGKPRAGLNDSELESYANDDDIKKLSVRDLAVGFARKWNGATTVASTMWIAHRAGISVFATGGIGGASRRTS